MLNAHLPITSKLNDSQDNQQAEVTQTSKPSFYAIIPAHVRYCKNLEPCARLLYGELTALSHLQGFCWASNRYFSALYDVDIRTIQRWISSLQKLNFIKVELTKNGLHTERRIYINTSFKINSTERQNCHIEVTKTPSSRGQNCHPNSTSLINTYIKEDDDLTRAREEKKFEISENEFIEQSSAYEKEALEQKPESVALEPKLEDVIPEQENPILEQKPEVESDPPKQELAEGPKFDARADILSFPIQTHTGERRVSTEEIYKISVAEKKGWSEGEILMALLKIQNTCPLIYNLPKYLDVVIKNQRKEDELNKKLKNNKTFNKKEYTCKSNQKPQIQKSSTWSTAKSETPKSNNLENVMKERVYLGSLVDPRWLYVSPRL